MLDFFYRLAALIAALACAAPGAVAQVPGPPASGAGPVPWQKGRQYVVTTCLGTRFTGVLVRQTAGLLWFDTNQSGRVQLARSSACEWAALAAPGKAPADTGLVAPRPISSYRLPGSGSRILLMPTGRGLARKEGYLQIVDLIVLSGEYGLTRHLSVAGLYSPAAGFGWARQTTALRVKASIPLRPLWHIALGGGAVHVPAEQLYNPRTGAYDWKALSHASVSYGPADNDVTAGIGVVGNPLGATYTLVTFGGQAQMSTAIKLVSENYYLAQSGIAGLYGVVVSGERVSGEFAGGYIMAFADSGPRVSPGGHVSYDNPGGRLYSSLFVPVYASLVVRFGRPWGGTK